MQMKMLNSYRITHKDGTIEHINAQCLVQALLHTAKKEDESPVVQTFMIRQNIATLVDELPKDILFTTIVDSAGGSIATPSSGKIHVGDSIAFRAIPARNYAFEKWTRNGRTISIDESFIYEMTPLLPDEDTAVFEAHFKLADVAWQSAVEPAEATGAGCVAFPMAGTGEANSSLSLIAVEAVGYTFDHWERNGENIGTNKILETTLSPLAENETVALYTAVFTTV